MKKQDKSKLPDIFVTRVEKDRVKLVLLGETPLFINRLSEKAKHELLYPKGRKSAGERAHTMKHDPTEEFRNSPHVLGRWDRRPLNEGEVRLALDSDLPTLLAMPAAAPKKAMAQAAIDLPGDAKKAQIGRLAWVRGQLLPVYGIPKLSIASVRNSDMNRTPDMRTRCVVPQWMIPLEVEFVSPILNATVIINLAVAAGMFVGLGDWRNEKGSGTFGQFEVLSQAQAKQNPLYLELLKQGRAAQIEAMDNFEPFDPESLELLTWFEAEKKVRGKLKKNTADDQEETQEEAVSEEGAA